MKFRSTKKIVTILSILVCLAVFGVYGTYSLIRKNIQKTVAADNRTAEQLAATEARKNLEDSIEKIGPEIDHLSSHILNQDQIVGFIEDIESRARKLNLKIEVQSAEERNHETLDKYKILELTVKTDGSWNNTYRYISLLESLPYKSTLGMVSLAASSQQGSSTQAIWAGSYKLSVLRSK